MSSSKNEPARGSHSLGDAELGASVPAMLVLAWFVPGGAHVAQGQVVKGLVFFATLVAMFAFGIAFGGRLFHLELSDPLIVLAGVAQWGLGVPRIAAGLFGWGTGNVTAMTYEYGNTFLITSGLLNALVVLDAYDLATGRRPR
jgi:hypothetical protein